MVLFGVLLVAPLAVFAAAGDVGYTVSCAEQNKGTIGFIVCKIGALLNLVIPVLIALGVVYFVWGVITYVISKEEEAKKAGRNRMIYGIIGLAVIVAAWGLVTILTTTFGIQQNTGGITFPTVDPGQ